jgi:hypothetical protein
MLRMLVIVILAAGACAPATTTPAYMPAPRPAYAAAAPAATARPRTVAIRGRVPRGKRVEYVVAVPIDPQGRRQRIRVRPAADGSYQLRLPPGHRYAMAYEDRGRMVGNVTFPSAGGRQSQVINISQNVVVQQQYVDLGEPTYVGGVFVATYDPEAYFDSDGDGTVDAQDPDDVDDDAWVADAGAFEGDFEDYQEPVDEGGYDAGGYDAGAVDDDHDDED